MKIVMECLGESLCWKDPGTLLISDWCVEGKWSYVDWPDHLMEVGYSRPECLDFVDTKLTCGRLMLLAGTDVWTATQYLGYHDTSWAKRLLDAGRALDPYSMSKLAKLPESLCKAGADRTGGIPDAPGLSEEVPAKETGADDSSRPDKKGETAVRRVVDPDGIIEVAGSPSDCGQAPDSIEECSGDDREVRL